METAAEANQTKPCLMDRARLSNRALPPSRAPPSRSARPGRGGDSTMCRTPNWSTMQHTRTIAVKPRRALSPLAPNRPDRTRFRLAGSRRRGGRLSAARGSGQPPSVGITAPGGDPFVQRAWQHPPGGLLAAGSPHLQPAYLVGARRPTRGCALELPNCVRGL